MTSWPMEFSYSSGNLHPFVGLIISDLEAASCRQDITICLNIFKIICRLPLEVSSSSEAFEDDCGSKSQAGPSSLQGNCFAAKVAGMFHCHPESMHHVWMSSLPAARSHTCRGSFFMLARASFSAAILARI